MADGEAGLRLFIAVEVPDSIKRSVEKAIQPIRMDIKDARWVPRENWHVTLKFLGEVEQERLAEVKEILAGSAKRAAPIQTRLTDIGSFPTVRRARVIWVGLEDPGQAMANLAARLEKKLGKAGFRQESRRLRPHLTLARLKSPRSVAETFEAAGALDLDRSPFAIDETVLFLSRLSRSGAEYEAIERFALGR